MKLRYEEIAQRLKNLTTRGIAIGKGQQLRDVDAERVILHEKYQDHSVDCSGATLEEVVQQVAQIVKDGRKWRERVGIEPTRDGISAPHWI